jgi:spermidine synthase
MKEFRETLYRDHAQVLAVDEVIHHGRTAFQEVLIVRNPTFGKVLALDGVVQLTERDSHIYHEMMAHVPLTAHGAARDVLIVGGGDGGVLKEVLKHRVRRVVVAELDPQVIALAREHFPAVSGGAFADARTAVEIGDAAAFVAGAHEAFDLVIVDSTDPVGPGEALFSEAFYRHGRAALRRDGLLMLQSGAPFYRPDLLERVRARVGACFGAARPLLAPVPTYASGLLALIAAGPNAEALCPREDMLAARMAGIAGGCRYYDPGVHQAAFSMAERLMEALAVDPAAP